MNTVKAPLQVQTQKEVSNAEKPDAQKWWELAQFNDEPQESDR